ncbi:hypothetical protein B7463_g4666, partial [Scytalidium lignicola]
MAAVHSPADVESKKTSPEEGSTDTNISLKDDGEKEIAFFSMSGNSVELQEQQQQQNEKKDDKNDDPPLATTKTTATTTTGTSEDDIVYPKGLKLAAIILALYLSILLIALDQTIISTAIPRITDQFHSIQDIGWYGSAYLLTSTALQPTFGRIYTIFSIKYTYITAIVIFELGSLVCATAPTSNALIVGRAIAGLGVGGLCSGGITIIAYTLPLQKRPAAFGLIGGIWGIASIAAPLLGGVFSLPIGAITVAFIFALLHIDREDNPENLTLIQRIRKLDLIGASILIPAVVCLLLALQWGGTTYSWRSSKIIGLFIGFALLTILFIASQIILGDRATLQPRFFRDRNVLCAMLFALFFGAAFFAIVYYLAIYFQSVKGSSATHAGIQLLPLMMSCVLSSIVTGALITVFGYYAPLMIFCMALFSVGAGLITTFSLTTPLSKWFGYQIIAGLGVGVGFQGGIITVQTVVDLVDVPVATACVSFFQTLGGAIFISVAQTLFQNGLYDGIRQNDPTLDASIFLNSGATQIRDILRQMGQLDKLDVVLEGYILGLRHTFWVTTACAIAAFCIACGLEWRSVKKGKGKQQQPENGGKETKMMEAVA